ncbi:MAG TPA: hypothetical protein VMZ28_03230 [Kofleriaceae bacterium]|nr:hypothetical protein [Kofleriaceae bacterium]
MGRRWPVGRRWPGGRCGGDRGGDDGAWRAAVATMAGTGGGGHRRAAVAVAAAHGDR